MEKTKHTPGPWVACGLESRSPYICADEGKKWDNPEICNLFNDVTPVDSVSGQWLEPLPNAAANARLIAAAPELVDALQSMVDAYQTHFDAMPVAWQTFDNIAQAALAKARGQ